MTSVKVTIAHGKPDRIEVNGEHVPHADFRYEDRDDGVRCVVITSREDGLKITHSFPVAHGTFEGETKPASS